MRNTRRSSDPRLHPAITLLFVVAIGCLGVGFYFAFRGSGHDSTKEASNRRPVTAETSAGGSGTRVATSAAVAPAPGKAPPDLTAGALTNAAPAATSATAESRLPGNDATDLTPSAVAAAAPTPVVTSDQGADPIADHPDLATSTEYASLKQALVAQDYLSARIVLNDFTTAPSGARECLELVLARWPERYGMMGDVAAAGKVTVKVVDPLSKEVGSVRACTAEGITLECAGSTRVVPWKQIPRSSYVTLWSDIIQRANYVGPIAVIGLVETLLADDYLNARVLARRIATANQGPLGENQLELEKCTETWSLLRLLLDMKTAERSSNPDLVEQLRVEARAIVRLGGNEWATALLDQPPTLKEPPTIATASPKAAVPIHIDGLDHDPTLSGSWNAARIGARCIGEGEMKLASLTGISGVKILFSPNACRGQMRISIKGASWLVNFTSCTLTQERAASSQSMIPVAIFPRWKNELVLSFGGKAEATTARINHDTMPQRVPGTGAVSEMRVSLSGGCDVSVKGFELLP